MITKKKILDAAEDAFGGDYQFMPDDPFIAFAKVMYRQGILDGAEKCDGLDSTREHRLCNKADSTDCAEALREMAREI